MVQPRKKKKETGETLVYLLVIIFLYSAVMLPIVKTVTLKMQLLSATVDREEALQIGQVGGFKKHGEPESRKAGGTFEG